MPLQVILGPRIAAIWDAEVKFQGRDRRRIKREIRKALDKLPRQTVGGIERRAPSIWKTVNNAGPDKPEA